MKKNIESALKSILSSEQVAVLKEEIATGIKKVNAAVDSNEKMKAKKEVLIETLIKVDKLIENSSRSPILVKAFYSAAKSNIKKLIQPILEKMIEEEEFRNLDDIPDAQEKKAVHEEKTVLKVKESSEVNNAEQVEKSRKKNFKHDYTSKNPSQEKKSESSAIKSSDNQKKKSQNIPKGK